jgi:hypothetical protein
MPRYRSLAEHLDATVGPKRILALDGGGLRGMLSVGLLYRLERLLRERFGDPGLLLADYFDLIAGTSTGAIIAGGLALGMEVREVDGHYRQLGKVVFKESFWRDGVVRSSYDADEVAQALQKVFGHRTLGSEDLKTGLLVVSKRFDTGSAWPLANNPAGKYFGQRAGSRALPNGEYPLWQVVRASTAAPTYFDPEYIRVYHGDQPSAEPLDGRFIDGGMSPHNNPALQALMTATMQGYRFNWPTGADRLLVVSLGTGKANPKPLPLEGAKDVAANQGIQALKALMEDCGDLVETMLQWLSQSPTARRIDAEMEKANPPLGGQPLLSYLRYNVIFEKRWCANHLGKDYGEEFLRRMEAMDKPEQMQDLFDLGVLAAERLMSPGHLVPAFDHGLRWD